MENVFILDKEPHYSVTECLFGGQRGWGGGQTFVLGPRGRYGNEGCTIKSQMGAANGGWHGVNGGLGPTGPIPVVMPLPHYGIADDLCIKPRWTKL